ncbi:unnamed protein product [Caenorhabditis auriculariae]|uniref:Uncharacterized protein n=1 Tax=Caenorhabditis auriculariae TaxID=2777116 RepID=A0A8S1HUK9_9PELO|nr:unnamed protein product [Caenorhabditis auriculariae]
MGHRITRDYDRRCGREETQAARLSSGSEKLLCGGKRGTKQPRQPSIVPGDELESPAKQLRLLDPGNFSNPFQAITTSTNQAGTSKKAEEVDMTKSLYDNLCLCVDGAELKIAEAGAIMIAFSGSPDYKLAIEMFKKKFCGVVRTSCIKGYLQKLAKASLWTDQLAAERNLSLGTLLMSELAMYRQSSHQESPPLANSLVHTPIIAECRLPNFPPFTGKVLTAEGYNGNGKSQASQISSILRIALQQATHPPECIRNYALRLPNSGRRGNDHEDLPPPVTKCILDFCANFFGYPSILGNPGLTVHEAIKFSPELATAIGIDPATQAEKLDTLIRDFKVFRNKIFRRLQYILTDTRRSKIYTTPDGRLKWVSNKSKTSYMFDEVAPEDMGEEYGGTYEDYDNDSQDIKYKYEVVDVHVNPY